VDVDDDDTGGGGGVGTVFDDVLVLDSFIG